MSYSLRANQRIQTQQDEGLITNSDQMWLCFCANHQVGYKLCAVNARR